MCLKLGDGQVELRPAFRTTEPHRILKHLEQQGQLTPELVKRV